MSVDIVNLIESNPITKFSGNYQSKLVEKVKMSFTNYEQQLFLSSFYCYLKYDPNHDFVIDLDNVWKWLEFSNKAHGKTVLTKNFIVNKDYKFLLTKMGEQTNSRGGHNKQIIMMNVDTFKKFCLKACTKKADEIHDYFIKLETIMFEIAEEECIELKIQLQQIEHIKNKETEDKLISQKVSEKEKLLLKHFATIGNMIYIIKVKSYENSSYVIKIGESRKGIQHRYSEHKTKYDECILLDCFEVDKSKDFETFLHHHSLIYTSKVTNLKDHETENELFLIGFALTYNALLKIINDNIHNYNYNVRELLLEIENLKLKNNGDTINNDNEMLKELTITNKLLVNKVCYLETAIDKILHKLNEKETKVVTGFNQQIPNLGPRLQQINPKTLQLVRYYESVTEAMNENKHIKRPSIMKSAEENTIYCGFRWLLVERNLEPTIVHSIQPTKETKVQSLGYIAKLNADKTLIINVYLDRKTAANLNGYQSSTALDNPVKQNTVTKGHHYMLYSNCDPQLIYNFEMTYGIPLLYKNGVGQFNLDHKLVREYACKYDCIKELKISDKTLAKALDNGIPYNNYYFKYMESKLKSL
jgi:hypothetical protein